MNKKIMLALTVLCGTLSATAQDVAQLAARLMSLPAYQSNAVFEVLLPSAQDPVVYEIALQSDAVAVGDTLSPCDYVIEWSTQTSSGTMSGFSAYYDGNHYRYRNNRLQEYHMAASEMPFMPQGPGSLRQGVQYTAQFADLLPQFIGLKISDIISDTTYIFTYNPDARVGGRQSIVLEGVKRGAGYDVMRFSYTFDRATMLPVQAEIETSPGSISEQVMNITYTAADREPISIDEQGLMARWPDVFEKYRQSTFRAENLVNTPLPAFSCQMLDSSDRYTHHADERFGSPTVIVFLDPAVSTTPTLVNALREAAEMSPVDFDILWVFTSNNQNEVSETVGKLGNGERALFSANSLVRNCGITLYPTTLIVGSDATVREVIPGYNNDTALIVLQKVMLVK